MRIEDELCFDDEERGKHMHTSCIGNDRLCPCQDGDACHYVDLPGSPAWPLPKLSENPNADTLAYWQERSELFEEKEK